MSSSLPNRENDWDWARHRYETSDLSCDQIGTEIGVSATSIVSKASRQGWTRNRRENSIERSAELVLAQKLSREEEIRIRFEAVEKVNTAMQAELLQRHRHDINHAKAICLDLFNDLKESRADVDPETRMGLMDTSMVMQRLANSMKTFILLERQAYGIAGVIEDPEVPRQQQTVPVAVLDSVMDKFAKVLQFSREKPITLSPHSNDSLVIENGATR